MTETDQLRPVPADERNLGGTDMMLLWAGAAVSLAEIWAGGMLAPLGFAAGLVVIVLGRMIGNLPLALAGIMGAREGLPSMVATRPSLGIAGSYLASILNIIQLIGWTAVMLFIAGHAASALAKPFGSASTSIWMIMAGVGTTLWALGGAKYWRWLHRISISALILLCLQMTWLVAGRLAGGEVKAPAGGLGWGIGLDLVLAMSISWLPLAADYARFAKSSRGAGWGSWWGYFIVSAWMYALGLGAAVATGSDTPEAMIMALMAESGWLLPALAIVLLSTFTTTFLDVYSTAVSSLNLPVNIGHKGAVIAAGVLGTIIALAFSAYAYEPFLLYIGSFFCPLFGLVLADYFIVRRSRFPSNILDNRTLFNWAGIIAWAAGFAIYRLALNQGWPMGASLPSFVGAGLIHVILAKAINKN